MTDSLLARIELDQAGSAVIPNTGVMRHALAEFVRGLPEGERIVVERQGDKLLVSRSGAVEDANK